MEDALKEKIIKYLDGELSSHEKDAFEEEMSIDSNLSLEVSKFKQILESIEKKAHDELRQELATYLDEYKKAEAKVKNPAWGIMAIAASIIGLVFLGYFIFNEDQGAKVKYGTKPIITDSIQSDSLKRNQILEDSLKKFGNNYQDSISE